MKPQQLITIKRMINLTIDKSFHFDRYEEKNYQEALILFHQKYINQLWGHKKLLNQQHRNIAPVYSAALIGG